MTYDLIITIFGSTGDLTARKLLPAITKLYEKKLIPQKTKVLALGRRDYDTEKYLLSMQKLTSKNLNLDILSELVEYYKIQITDEKAYPELAKYLESITHSATEQMYYLAIGPELLSHVALSLHRSNLVKKGHSNQKIIFEKPFGHDLKSAIEINQMLWQYFDEKQIFRIDHYLGKDMIQNIMTVRFANRIFEDTWDSKSIQSVKIYVKEKNGILNRAGYYDQSGALKDMVQSHLLQMLCLIAMDPPKQYQSDFIKDEKIKVLKSLTLDEESVIFGQYEGYLSEPNIDKDSQTETFVYFKAYVNTPRFRGVPFEILTGKKLSKKQSFIEITYYPTTEQEKWKLPLSQNKLTIKIDPKDAVELNINSKKPGLKENIEQVNLSFKTAESIEGNIPEAYEKLILDIYEDHKTLFTRWDEIEASWLFIDQIKKCPHELLIYKNEKDIIKYMHKKTGPN